MGCIYIVGFSSVSQCSAGFPEYFIYHWKSEPEVSGDGQMGASGKLSSGLWENALFLQPVLSW